MVYKMLAFIALVLGITASLLIVCHTQVLAAETFTVPIVPSGGVAGAADPWVIFKDGYYYYCKSVNDGAIGVAKARRLQDIGKVPMVTVWTPPAGTSYSKEIWAPELHEIDGKWYIYFAADDGKNENHRMYVLEGAAPQEPFTFKGKITDTTDKWAIDGTVLTSEGKHYFVWSGWEGDTNVSQSIYIAPMSNPWTISGPRVELSRPEHTWETIGKPLINEGPEILTRNGKIHIIYSASGSWTDDYCLGQLTYTSGNILDKKSWKKKGPVFGKSPTAFGPGHASFTISPDGTEHWIIYHAYQNSGGGWANRSVRAQKFTWNPDDSPNFGTPLPFGAVVTEPSGTPAEK